MTKFYKTKEEARPIADALLEAHKDRISFYKIELEPYNGWCIVLMPRMTDLSDLYEDHVVREPVLFGHNLSGKMKGRKPIPDRAVADARVKTAPPPPPAPPPAPGAPKPKEPSELEKAFKVLLPKDEPAAAPPPPPPPPKKA